MPRGEANESQKFWWSGPVVVKREGGAEARQCMICMYTVPALEVAGCCRLLQLATHLGSLEVGDTGQERAARRQ